MKKKYKCLKKCRNNQFLILQDYQKNRFKLILKMTSHEIIQLNVRYNQQNLIVNGYILRKLAETFY